MTIESQRAITTCTADQRNEQEINEEGEQKASVGKISTD